VKKLAAPAAFRHEPAFCRRHHKQRGASLLESIAYLGVAAIVIVGAIALLGSAFSSANTNKLAQELNAIQTGTRKLYMGQANNYGADSAMNGNLVAAKVFPGTLTIAADGTVSNTWGGTVTVKGAGQTFTVAYSQVPREVCINTLSAGGNWKSAKIGEKDLPYPVTPDDATKNCTDNATVTWTSN
jgi:hypothetical protein